MAQCKDDRRGENCSATGTRHSGAAVTTCFKAFDLLLANFGSPPYTAMIVSVPTFSVEVVKVVDPLLSVPVPSTVLPSMKLTVSPSGGLPALEVTVAVKVTGWPEVEGFGEDVSVVVVAAGGVRTKP